MSQYDLMFGLKINVDHSDLYFMVQWFYLISWRLFDVWTSYFRIMSQYDLMFDLKINVDHCDLYFMVQWFCLIFWRLFDVRTPYFGIMSQYDLMFGLKINGPRQANLVLIAYASSEGSGEPGHPRSLARTFAARSYKQWVKRNLQTESQIPGPSKWLGMRS